MKLPGLYLVNTGYTRFLTDQSKALPAADLMRALFGKDEVSPNGSLSLESSRTFVLLRRFAGLFVSGSQIKVFFLGHFASKNRKGPLPVFSY